MTVQSSYAKAGPYLPEGQTVFPFRFRVLAPEQVRVYLGTSALEPMSGYSVNLSDNGGEVVFTNPPTEAVTMLRDMDFGQSVDLQNNTAFLAEVLEEALDKLTMMCQQLKTDTDRAVKVSVDSGDSPDEYYGKILSASADAVSAASEAEDARNHAVEAEASGIRAAQSSADSESRAATSAQSAQQSATAAQSAEDAAQDYAQSAANAAQSAAAVANTVAVSVSAAQSAASSSENSAIASENSAKASASSASNSENSAIASAASAQSASDDAAAVREIRSEIENYFGNELKELTINLIGDAAVSAEYIAQEVGNVE